MTDPTTLSAAELDALANREVCFTNGIGWRIVLTTEECDALVATARRTEAAERKLAKLAPALDHIDHIASAGAPRAPGGQQVGPSIYQMTLSTSRAIKQAVADIRRALAED